MMSNLIAPPHPDRPGPVGRRAIPKIALFRRVGRRARPVAPSLDWPRVVLVLSVAIVLAGAILDAASVSWARGLAPGVRSFGRFLGEVGQSQWFLLPTGVLVILLLLGDWTRAMPAIRRGWTMVGIWSGYIFLSVGLGAIAVNLLKIVFGRARPVLFDQAGWLTLDPFTISYQFASFPSGHSTTAGAFLVSAAMVFPRARFGIVLFGIALGVSRVVVGAHYPSDVIAGLALGGAIAYLLARFLAARRFAFAPDGADRIRPCWPLVRRAVQEGGMARFLLAPLRALAS